MKNIIRVTSRKKITSLRISEPTKKELESLGHKGETHEEIIERLIKFVKNTIDESDTQFIKRKNVIGTKYGRLNRKFQIEIDDKRYDLVCTFNDISLMTLLTHNKNLKSEFGKEWEMDLEIVNIGISKKKSVIWRDAENFRKNHPEKYRLLYLIVIKQILEDMFGIKIYELVNTEDYFNHDNWRALYKRNNLSIESFYKDIEKKLR